MTDMKDWFLKRIAWLKRPRTWIGIGIVAVIVAVFVLVAVGFQRPAARKNPNRVDAAQVYFTHLANAADSNRILFEEGGLPDGVSYDDTLLPYDRYAHATVIEVLEDRTTEDESTDHVRVGYQILDLEITTGEHKGLRITAESTLGRMVSKYAEKGTSLLVSLRTYPKELDETGSPRVSVSVLNYNRTVPLLIIVGLFLLVTALVGGKVGLRSILGLLFTLAAIIWVLIPALTRGSRAVPITLAVCCAVTIVCFILLDGVNRKTVSAILGTIAGFCAAALFAMLASALTHTDGLLFDSSETSTLIDAKDYQDWAIDIRGLFVSGIIISSLGAVMDVAMSISSSINELKTVNRDMRFLPLLKSGMHIGRDAIGTMTNTLILAFVGSALTSLIILKTKSWPLIRILSDDVITHEIISGVAGSIGLILAVPLTALIASALCERFPGLTEAPFGKPKKALPEKKR